MKKTRYAKPVAEVLLFDLEDVKMKIELISSNNGEDNDGSGDNKGDEY